MYVRTVNAGYVTSRSLMFADKPKETYEAAYFKYKIRTRCMDKPSSTGKKSRGYHNQRDLHRYVVDNSCNIRHSQLISDNMISKDNNFSYITHNSAVDSYITSGDIDRFQRSIKMGIPCIADMVILAIDRDKLKIVEYMVNIDCPIVPGLLAYLIRSNSDSLGRVLSRNPVYGDEIIDLALTYNNITMMKYIYSKGYKPTDEILSRTITRCTLPIIDMTINHGKFQDNPVFMIQAIKTHKCNTIKLLSSRGFACDMSQIYPLIQDNQRLERMLVRCDIPTPQY